MVLQRICVLTSTLLDGVKLSVYDVFGETTVLRYERWSVVRNPYAFDLWQFTELCRLYIGVAMLAS